MIIDFRSVCSSVKLAQNVLKKACLAVVLASFSSVAEADVAAGLASLDAGKVSDAATEFQESFQSGEADGAFYLGRLFEFGIGTEKDQSRAANLYAAGSEAGSTLAMNRLGVMYLEGTVLLRDYALAAKQFCLSAEAGDTEGKLNCALMQREGKGIEKNEAGAIAYLEEASGDNNVVAANILALMYQGGEGVDASPEKARALFQKTADLGNALGLYELAKLHANPGEEQAADLISAYSYANLAAVRQHQDAIALRNGLEAKMTPEQIAEAQDMSRSWAEARIAEQAIQ